MLASADEIEQIDSQVDQAEFVEAVEQAPRRAMDLPTQIQNKWQESKNLIEAGEFSKASFKLQELSKLKSQAQFESLELVSLELLEFATQRLAKSDLDYAAFLTRQALKFSPTSTKVWFHSIPIARATGVGSMGEHLTAVLSLVTQEPYLLLELVNELVYPILWALSIGLYITLIACFVVRVRDYTEAVARKVPLKLRGIFGPIAACILLIIPCIFGPLWALAGWSLTLFFFLPRYRWIGFLAGAVLSIWGMILPVRENVALWFRDPATQVLLRVATGSFLAIDKDVLVDLTSERPKDGVLFYTLGQLQRKYGELKASQESFERAQELLGRQPWTRAQLGSLAFLLGESEKAKELYEEAESFGLNSGAFYFNYSKIAFELMNTAEARDLFQLARSKNERLVKTLEEREDELGMNSEHSLADIALPAKTLLASALKPIQGTKARERRLSSELMPGLGASGITILGVLILVMFLFFGGNKKATRLQTYFLSYKHSGLVSATLRILPGGSWVLSGRAVWGFLIASLSVLLLMPVFRWPVQTADLLDSLPGAYRMYAGFVALCLFLLLFVGTQLEEES